MAAMSDTSGDAAIEVDQVVEQSGMLPWAVPEVDPAAVVALFVREDNGTVLSAQRLVKRDTAALPFLEWSTSEPGDPLGFFGRGFALLAHVGGAKDIENTSRGTWRGLDVNFRTPPQRPEWLDRWFGGPKKPRR